MVREADVMKTITEFSGTILREAAKVPHRAPPAPGAEAPAPPVDEAGAAPPEDQGVPAPAPEEGAEGEGAEAPSPETGAAPSADATAASMVDADAVGTALNVSGDRLARLVEALIVVGRRVEGVRRVLVLGPENPPPAAKKQGDFFYLVEMNPQGDRGGRRDDRRGRGGRDRDDRRGGRPGEGRGGRPGEFGRGGRPGEGREREPRSNEVPSVGTGWMLSRAPGEPGDRRGPRRGPGGRRGGGPPGERRGGPPGERRGGPPGERRGGPPGDRGRRPTQPGAAPVAGGSQPGPAVAEGAPSPPPSARPVEQERRRPPRDRRPQGASGGPARPQGDPDSIGNVAPTRDLEDQDDDIGNR